MISKICSFNCLRAYIFFFSSKVSEYIFSNKIATLKYVGIKIFNHWYNNAVRLGLLSPSLLPTQSFLFTKNLALSVLFFTMFFHSTSYIVMPQWEPSLLTRSNLLNKYHHTVSQLPKWAQVFPPHLKICYPPAIDVF